MRGDYVIVTLQTGDATIDKKVQAMTAGSRVDWSRPGRSDQFLEVEARNQAGGVVEKALFSVTAIVCITEGHETLGGQPTKKR